MLQTFDVPVPTNLHDCLQVQEFRENTEEKGWMHTTHVSTSHCSLNRKLISCQILEFNVDSYCFVHIQTVLILESAALEVASLVQNSDLNFL